MYVTDMETGIASVRNLVGRHPVILNTASEIQIELWRHLPVVGKIQGEFVFISFSVLRRKFVESMKLTDSPVRIVFYQQARYTACLYRAYTADLLQ